jgi:hypothetical protein
MKSDLQTTMPLELVVEALRLLLIFPQPSSDSDQESHYIADAFKHLFISYNAPVDRCLKGYTLTISF